MHSSFSREALQPGQKLRKKIRLVAKRVGRKEVIVGLNTRNFTGFNGSCTVNVKPKE